MALHLAMHSWPLTAVRQFQVREEKSETRDQSSEATVQDGRHKGQQDSRAALGRATLSKDSLQAQKNLPREAKEEAGVPFPPPSVSLPNYRISPAQQTASP